MTRPGWWARSRAWTTPAQVAFAIALILAAALIIATVTDPGAREQPAAASDPTSASTVTAPPATAARPTEPTSAASTSNSTTTSTAPSSTTVAPPASLLPALTITAPTHAASYDRDLFGSGWTDTDRDCQDTRAEVLIRQTETPAVLDRCRVRTGRWTDPWSGTITTDASDLDVDHTVPLANAWRSGAWAWPPARRLRYANYLTNPSHLIAIPAGENRSKGDDGPEDWRPPDPGSWCEYALVWARIKDRWSLTVSPAEWSALTDMTATC